MSKTVKARVSVEISYESECGDTPTFTGEEISSLVSQALEHERSEGALSPDGVSCVEISKPSVSIVPSEELQQPSLGINAQQDPDSLDYYLNVCDQYAQKRFGVDATDLIDHTDKAIAILKAEFSNDESVYHAIDTLLIERGVDTALKGFSWITVDQRNQCPARVEINGVEVCFSAMAHINRIPHFITRLDDGSVDHIAESIRKGAESGAVAVCANFDDAHSTVVFNGWWELSSMEEA